MLQFLLNATNQKSGHTFFYIIHIIVRDKEKWKEVERDRGLRTIVTSNNPPKPDSVPLYLVKLLCNK